MPYGMPKKMGGDTKMMDMKMEDCVTKMMGKGKSKVSAIKICKSSMMRSVGLKARVKK